MNVGVVVYGDLDRRSGGYLYDAEVVDRLRRRGDDVEVVSVPERSYPASLLSNASRTLRRRLRTAEFDVCLQDELCHPSLAAANRRLDTDYPVVTLVHHLRADETRGPWRRRAVVGLERRYLESVDGYVCVSESTRRAVAGLVGDDDGGDALPGPSVVARPGNDRFGDPLPADRVRERARQSPLRVLFVGSVVPRKGLETLVRGLSRVPGDWRLTVVGDTGVDPAYVDRVRDAVADCGVADRVAFAGRVPDATLRDHYERSHLLAVPSRHEGYGIVYAEGMRFGLPAVASAAGGASELVADRENGFLVEPGDESAVCDAVAPLCRNRRRLLDLSLAARETGARHPSWDDTADRVRSFLASVVDGRPRPAPAGETTPDRS
jgi:glycosyltransferase involved in cell wall biosynthesis